MNVWKPIALCSAAGLVASIAMQTASAQTNAGNCKNQPNMLSAINSLRAAKASLEKAEHNKGGWRDRAIAATSTAIKETENGCAVADVK